MSPAVTGALIGLLIGGLAVAVLETHFQLLCRGLRRGRPDQTSDQLPASSAGTPLAVDPHGEGLSPRTGTEGVLSVSDPVPGPPFVVDGSSPPPGPVRV